MSYAILDSCLLGDRYVLLHDNPEWPGKFLDVATFVTFDDAYTSALERGFDARKYGDTWRIDCESEAT